MIRIVIVVFLCLCFYSCKNEIKGINKNNHTNKKKTIVYQIQPTNKKHLFGANFKIKYPLRIGAYGNRFYWSDTGYNRICTIQKASLLKEQLKIKINLQEYMEEESCSYGYTRLSSNLFIEIVGFGWNDNSLTDDVAFFNYLIIHDSLGNVKSNKLIAYANNIDSIAYQEVFFKDSLMFTTIRYEFIKYIPCSECASQKQPIQVKLIRDIYTIKDSIIKHTGKLSPLIFQCETYYNEFGGIFKDNFTEIKETKYWMPKP